MGIECRKEDTRVMWMRKKTGIGCGVQGIRSGPERRRLIQFELRGNEKSRWLEGGREK